MLIISHITALYSTNSESSSTVTHTYTLNGCGSPEEVQGSIPPSPLGLNGVAT
jgi:hypothetical protein